MAPPLERSQAALFPDFPRGPLCSHRARASFSWKELALFWEGEHVLRFKKTVFSALESDPLFARPSGHELSMEKYQELTFLRCKRIFEFDFLLMGQRLQSPLAMLAFLDCLGMYDWSLAIKIFLHLFVFGSAIYNSGSERHFKYLPKIFSMEIFGCFAMTELSHGSDTKAIRTTAHYDPATEEFIIHSPDFEAAKFWVGNMGKTATHAVVFAQLHMPGGQCHGLHPFVMQDVPQPSRTVESLRAPGTCADRLRPSFPVAAGAKQNVQRGSDGPRPRPPRGGHESRSRIRDPKTLLPMPGVMVGNLGKKLGLNGLDNGFAMFHKVRIPRQDLLNRVGDVTPEGTYVTPFKDDRQRLGASLGSLSLGRVCIVAMSVTNLKLAVCIALRFSATRCQFGPAGGEEIPVLEYQLQQWRLLPYLAAAYALDHFAKSLFLDLAELLKGLLGGDRSARQAELGHELHALASASKPLASWTAQRGIQECREACGGHGYLAMNRLGDLRNDNDPNCTYEGDNNVLLQQTSNYLLGLLAHEGPGGPRFETPLKSVDFLEAYPAILGQRFQVTRLQDCLDSSVPLAAYEWLVCYLLRESHEKLSQEKRLGSSDSEARNNSQVYCCRSLALVFLERTVVRRFHEHTHGPGVPPPLRAVLRRLSALYGLWSLSQHTALLYRGGYFSGEQAGKMAERAILELCSQLKDDAVALVDVLAPPDFVLDAPIGRADGELYKNLWGAVLQESHVLERASWWPEFTTHKPAVGSLSSKL